MRSDSGTPFKVYTGLRMCLADVMFMWLGGVMRGRRRGPS